MAASPWQVSIDKHNWCDRKPLIPHDAMAQNTLQQILHQSCFNPTREDNREFVCLHNLLTLVECKYSSLDLLIAAKIRSKDLI